jgi:hypothetical protein
MAYARLWYSASRSLTEDGLGWDYQCQLSAQPKNGLEEAKKIKIIFQITREQKATGNGLPGFSPHLFSEFFISEQLDNPLRGALHRGNQETIDSILDLGANTADVSADWPGSLSTLLRRQWVRILPFAISACGGGESEN